jgi:hypothetical protein
MQTGPMILTVEDIQANGRVVCKQGGQCCGIAALCGRVNRKSILKNKN